MKILRQSGFSHVEARPLTFGIVYLIHRGSGLGPGSGVWAGLISKLQPPAARPTLIYCF